MGHATLFFIHDSLKDLPCQVTTLSHGMLLGLDFDCLDNDTIVVAFNSSDVMANLFGILLAYG